MANAKNTAELAELKAKFEEASSVVLTEYRGLTVAQISELRTALGFDVRTPSPEHPYQDRCPGTGYRGS